MFSERLKKLRKNTKLTQEKFADKFGIPRTTYSGYETGKSEPDLATITILADYFDVSIDFLTGRTEDPLINKKEKMNRIIDLSDDGIINLEFVFNKKKLSDSSKNKAIKILREVLRIEFQEEGS